MRRCCPARSRSLFDGSDRAGVLPDIIETGEAQSTTTDVLSYPGATKISGPLFFLDSVDLPFPTPYNKCATVVISTVSAERKG